MFEKKNNNKTRAFYSLYCIQRVSLKYYIVMIVVQSRKCSNLKTAIVTL